MSSSNALATNPKYCFMPGTESGPSYLAFARIGDVALGIKPITIMPGVAAGTEDSTLFVARIRSARVSANFWPAPTDDKVVKFQKNPENLFECWPNAKFEKVNAKRASTIAKAFMEGTPDGSPESREKFEDQVGGGKIGRKLAEFLVNLAGEENLVLTKTEIAAWLNTFYTPVLVKIHEKIAAHDKHQAAKAEAEANAPVPVKPSLGQFGLTGQSIQELKAELLADEPYDADNFEVSDDEVGDDNEDGEAED